MTTAASQTKVAELYGIPTFRLVEWKRIAVSQQCPFLNRKCLKNRKSEPEITIGTCTMTHSRKADPLMICPFRFLERSQIFTDCVHLLKLHEPGNELRIVTELSVPGGSIDYCLVSAREGKTHDFVGIELQTLDTTGTVWPERQRFLKSQRVRVKREDVESEKGFGINWKMTAKTVLVQLNHKIGTFEHLSKRLVLVLQDSFFAYIRREFVFDHIRGVRDGDPMQFHSYELAKEVAGYVLHLKERVSTDSAGIATSLGLQADVKVELKAMLDQIDAKLSHSTLFTVGGGPIPISQTAEIKAEEED